MHGDESLLVALKSVLAALGGTNAELARTIEPIVLANYASGRVAVVQRLDKTFSAEAYVQRVAGYYQEYHDLIYRLQQSDNESWQPHYVMLQKWAYRFLERRRVADGNAMALFEHAKSCATEAVLVILAKPFPYDTHFGPWACRVLKYCCIRYINTEVKAGQNHEQEPVELGGWDNWLENLKDPAGEQPLKTAELRHGLLTIIDQLASEARKTFILLHYFESKTLAEVAQIMGLSMNATYKLHHDALYNLRQVWHDMNLQEY